VRSGRAASSGRVPGCPHGIPCSRPRSRRGVFVAS
jgi:hypothetical protein